MGKSEEYHVFGLKNCDKSRAAAKVLGVEVIDVRDDSPTQSQLSAWIERFGDDLVNRRSTTFRTLSPAARELPILALLLAYPVVMKRPLILAPERHGFAVLGWTPASRAALGVKDM